MMQGRGVSIGDYRAPLFLAWQLTNRCPAQCLHCCEESGRDKAWYDEFTRAEALSLAREIVELGIAEAAFGGGEPLDVPHVWDVFDTLHKGGVGIKIETNGLPIGETEASLLEALEVDTIQISVDGASREVHERVRPGGRFHDVIRSLERVSKRGLPPEVVFVPTKLNFQDAVKVFDIAVATGARKFVSGPMMRLGRAALAWEELSLSHEQWLQVVASLENHAKKHPQVQLAVYPWDILEEIRVRRSQPQAMMLVVPNGKVKLLNALPFACADIRRHSLAEAWELYKAAWNHPDVVDFTQRAAKHPALLRHANECWDLDFSPAARRAA